MIIFRDIGRNRMTHTNQSNSKGFNGGERGASKGCKQEVRKPQDGLMPWLLVRVEVVMTPRPERARERTVTRTQKEVQ